MSASVEQDPILGHLLQKSEAFQQQVSEAISAVASRNKELESQYQSKIAALERELELSNVEVKRLKVSKASIDHDVPSKGFFPPMTPTPKPTRIIDGVEYVTKDEYHKLLKTLQQTGKKYNAVQQRLEDLKHGAEPGKGTPQVQYRELSQELQMERLKVKEFERKLETLTQLLDVTQGVIKSVVAANTDASKRYKKYGEADDLWKAEMLEKGIIAASDFDRRPSRDPWPSIAIPLKQLSKTINGNNIMRTRGQSMPPSGSTAPTPTPCPPTRLPRKITPPPISPPTQDPDATSDEEEEEPESALQKFSPTSRAIMRKPGSETLAVLHPEPLSPIESHHVDADWEITEEALVNIKSEATSEPDWYSKYGYSRLVSGEQETFDLDNITVRRQSSTGLRHFGQAITTPEKNSIRTPFLTQSSQRIRSSDSTAQDVTIQPTAARSKSAPMEPIVITDSTEEATDATNPEGTSKTPNADLNPASKPNVLKVPSKPKSHPERVSGPEALVDSGSRNPLGEIPDPNGLPGPNTRPTVTLQPASRKMRSSNITPIEVSNDKENPPTASKINNLLSTPTQNEKLPPPVTRSAGAIDGLKSKRRNLGSLSTRKQRQPAKRSSLVFPPFDEPTTVVELAHNDISPGGKRLPEAPQAGSHKKKQRVEGTPTTPTANAKVDNPFSPSKYRINKNKNDGFDFAFGEVVRDKARKDFLPRCVKECCRDLASGKLHEMWEPPVAYKAPKFSAAGSSQPDEEEERLLQRDDQYRAWNEAREKSERHLEFGRHGAQHQKAAEVMGYWDSDFPTTQQLAEQGKESERRYTEKGYMRHKQATKGGMYERRE